MTVEMAKKIIKETPAEPTAEQMRLLKMAISVVLVGALKPPGAI
jgi:hypothetical protein